MSEPPGALPHGEAIPLASLITPTPHGIASRVLSRTSGGNLTIFAFAAGQELSEHTAPYDALVLVLEGRMTVTVGGVASTATAGTVLRMPANVPHAVAAAEPSRMLLLMLRELKT